LAAFDKAAYDIDDIDPKLVSDLNACLWELIHRDDIAKNPLMALYGLGFDMLTSKGPSITTDIRREGNELIALSKTWPDNPDDVRKALERVCVARVKIDTWVSELELSGHAGQFGKRANRIVRALEN
jgi:hypothetical protein